MIEQAHGVLVEAAYSAVSAMTGRKAMLRALYGRVFLLYFVSAGLCRCCVWRPAC
jgi:hypothetical protein